ncbi:oligoribonuclease [Facilibium subflavum]|uniref:oligoribonuclease n=1 Tax=Facilibium subflavum TaxID=2219058 RepID=UPI000E64C92B|nr:oligoribonuclease [Facilibium subflavum]
MSQQNLVWLDLEMTGLELDHCHIIEIAAIITDSELNVIAESQAIAIHQPDEIMDSMNQWCKTTHGASGLTQRVKESNISLKKAEQMILDFIKPHVAEKASPLCGNSIWQDRRFLARYMPTLENYFHYRLLDVSAFKIAANLWSPELVNGFEKKNAHLALDDIKESIEEMKYYKDNFLKLPI